MDSNNIGAEESNTFSTPELKQPDFKPVKPVIFAAISLGRMIFHPEIHFEEGAEADILEHKENGGSLFILMTHFKRTEPGLLFPLAGSQKALKHIRYNTGLTARAELWKIPGLKLLLDSVNAVPVERSTERPDELPDEKLARQDANQRKQEIVGRFLAAGKNWIIFPEGSTKTTVIENGEPKRVQRDNKTLLPIRKGFVYSLEAMTEEERQNVRLLAVANYFGPRILGSFRPTTYVCRPVEPINGTSEDMLKQWEVLLREGIEHAMAIDTKRR